MKHYIKCLSLVCLFATCQSYGMKPLFDDSKTQDYTLDTQHAHLMPSATAALLSQEMEGLVLTQAAWQNRDIEGQMSESKEAIKVKDHSNEPIFQLLYNILDPMPTELINLILEYLPVNLVLEYLPDLHQLTGRCEQIMTKNLGGAHMFIALSNGIIAYENCNKIVLLDTENGSIQTIKPPAHTLSQLVKQSAATFVAVTKLPEKICLYAIDGTLIKDFELEKNLYLTIKLTKNLIAGLCRPNSGGPQIQIWSTKDGVCKKTIPTTWLFNLVKLSQKQKLLATCEYLSDNISVWNWKTGECIRKFSATSNHHSSVHLTRLSDTVLATHSGKELKLWDYYSGTCLRTIPQDDHIWNVVVLPNKSFAIALGGKIKILSLFNNQQKIFTAHENGVIDYSISLSNGQLLTASIDQQIPYWNENTEVKIWS